MKINYVLCEDYERILRYFFIKAKRNLAKESQNKTLILIPKDMKKQLEYRFREWGIVDKNLNLEILSLEELCLKICRHKLSNNIKLADSEELFFKMYSATNSVELDVFNEIKSKESFINMLLNILENNKLNDISIEKLIDKNTFNNNESLDKKINDINKIFTLYQKNNTSDEVLTYGDLVNKCLNQKILNSYADNVFLVGYDNLKQKEIQLIKQISSNQNLINIGLVTNQTKDDQKIHDNNRKIHTLINNFKGNNIKEKVTYLKPNKNANSELSFLSNNFFSFSEDKYEGTLKHIRINKSENIYDEIENVAINIKRLILNHNCKLEDILIVSTNQSLHESIIKNTFSNYGIPLNKIDLFSNTQLCKLTQIILNILKNGLTPNLFLDLIKNNFYEFTLSEIALIQDILIRRYFEFVDEHTFKDESFTEEYLHIKVNNVIKNISTLKSELDNDQSFENISNKIYKYLELEGFYTTILNRCNKTMDDKELSSYKNFIKILDILHNLKIDGVNKYLDLFVAYSNRSKIKSNIKMDNSVKIIGLSNIGYEKYKAVFFIGLNEENILSKPSCISLFNNEELLYLNSLRAPLDLTMSDKIDNEKYNIYKVLKSCTDKLYLSYSVLNDSGEFIKESLITKKIKQKFTNFNYTETKYNPDIKLDKNEHIKELSSTLREYKEDILYTKKSTNEYVNKVVESVRFTNAAVCTNFDSLKSLYFNDLLSVSKLENHARCPFSYLMKHGLYIRQRETFEMDLRKIGIYIHEIIEHISKLIVSNNSTWDNINTYNLMESINNLYGENKENYKCFNISEKNKNILQRLNKQAFESINAIATQINLGYFKPLGYEIKFRNKSEFPALKINLSSGKTLDIVGQIDRVDELNIGDESYIRIVDYKTGSKSIDYTDIVNGTQLQLLIYLDSILNSQNKKYIPAGIFYFNSKSPLIKAKPNVTDDFIQTEKLKALRLKGLFLDNSEIVSLMDKGLYENEYTTSLTINAKLKTDGELSKSTPGISLDTFDILRTYSLNMAKSISEDIMNGVVNISPIKKNSSTPCIYCEYKSICKFEDGFKGNKYRYSQKLKKEDALEYMIDFNDSF